MRQVIWRDNHLPRASPLPDNLDCSSPQAWGSEPTTLSTLSGGIRQAPLWTYHEYTSRCKFTGSPRWMESRARYCPGPWSSHIPPPFLEAWEGSLGPVLFHPSRRGRFILAGAQGPPLASAQSVGEISPRPRWQLNPAEALGRAWKLGPGPRPAELGTSCVPQNTPLNLLKPHFPYL